MHFNTDAYWMTEMFVGFQSMSDMPVPGASTFQAGSQMPSSSRNYIQQPRYWPQRTGSFFPVSPIQSGAKKPFFAHVNFDNIILRTKSLPGFEYVFFCLVFYYCTHISTCSVFLSCLLISVSVKLYLNIWFLLVNFLSGFHFFDLFFCFSWLWCLMCLSTSISPCQNFIFYGENIKYLFK